jgi:hypothetical protein
MLCYETVCSIQLYLLYYPYILPGRCSGVFHMMLNLLCRLTFHFILFLAIELLAVTSLLTHGALERCYRIVRLMPIWNLD